MKLNLGCSGQIKVGWQNVDCRQLPGVDRVVDLDKKQWPWKDESIDEILMLHTLEHLHDPLAALKECHRVLKVGGKITVRVPHGSGALAYFPDHYTQFSMQWFYALADSCDCRFELDWMWAQQVIKMSLGYYRVHGKSLWIRLFRQIWETFWNATPVRQTYWEMLGLFPPGEILWTAVKK